MGRLARHGAVLTAGLVATLALTACGSGDDGGKAEDSGTEQGATPGAGTEDGAEPGADAAALDGTWAGLSDGKAVALSVASGKVALVADQHVCQGDVKDMGKVMLALSCTDGNTDRTMGSIESNDGKTLVVSWDAGAKDTLTKTDPAKLPTGLPDLSAP